MQKKGGGTGHLTSDLVCRFSLCIRNFGQGSHYWRKSQHRSLNKKRRRNKHKREVPGHLTSDLFCVELQALSTRLPRFTASGLIH